MFFAGDVPSSFCTYPPASYNNLLSYVLAPDRDKDTPSSVSVRLFPSCSLSILVPGRLEAQWWLLICSLTSSTVFLHSHYAFQARRVTLSSLQLYLFMASWLRKLVQPGVCSPSTGATISISINLSLLFRLLCDHSL